MAEVLVILGHVVTPVTEAGKALVATIKHQASYLLCYKRNVDDLNKEVENLRRARNDVQGRVDADSRNGQVVTEVVQQWLKNVEDVKEDAERLDGRVKESISCFNLRSRFRLGKEAKKMMNDVSKLKTDGNFRNVSYPPPPPTIGPFLARDLMPLESRESAMKQVMDALKKDNVNMIGVYGMGGVGKTTLIKEVAKMVKKEKLFDNAIMVILTQKPDSKGIQGEIAEQLGLELKAESQVVRAGKLSERLKQELKSKKILLIFDNIWEILDLDDLGIPVEWNHSGWKIVFTTRSMEVCGAMKSQAKILVDVLSKEDAWNLFKEKVGDVVDSPSLHVVARAVAEECGGLPLAIVTLGMALQDKDKTVWDHALLQLQRSNLSNVKGMDGKVFSSVEMSYNYLKRREAQLCFLYCCLFSEGRSIHKEEMMIYGMGEGLFKGVNTLEEASDRVHVLFDELKASCLLLEGDVEMSVKMHDVVRDVALSIASRAENGFLVKANAGLKEWPEVENLKECKRISLAGNEIRMLPPSVECPQLLTLLLNVNYSLKEIPTSFFQGMISLKVLDLCDTGISSLPSSLQCLTNLRTLWLDRWPQLKDVSLLGVLKNLEILSLQETGICELMEQMGNLANIKRLDLSKTNSLEKVAPNVISRLTRLEELYMGNSFNKWGFEGIGDARQASLAEMISLSRLTILYIHIKNFECSSQDVPGPWKNLKKFRICIGGDYTESTIERSMKVENLSSPVSIWVKLLFGITYELELVQCKGLKNVTELGKVVFNSLEYLYITKCGEMEHVVNVEEEAQQNEFENLKELHLNGLKKLKTIFHGSFPAQFLKKLRVLKVLRCDKLINIVPSDLLRFLHNVEEVKVCQCDGLLEVFHCEGTTEEDDILSKLMKLKLNHLPKLSSIWKGAIPLGSLHNLVVLDVERCHSLRCVFTPSLAQRLKKLKKLYIYYCKKMEKLVVAEDDEIDYNEDDDNDEDDHNDSNDSDDDGDGDDCDDDDDDDDNNDENNNNNGENGGNEEEKSSHGIPPHELFPNLQRLSVKSCNCLKTLFPLSLARGLQQLEHLNVVRCRGMRTIIAVEEEVVEKFLFNGLRELQLIHLQKLTSFYQGTGLVELPCLRELMVSRCPKLKQLLMEPQSSPNQEEIQTWPMRRQSMLTFPPRLLPHGMFHNLRELIISECGSIRTLFSLSIAQALQQLEELLLGDCPRIEVIISVQEEQVVDQGLFPQLRRLSLIKLESLTSFCEVGRLLDWPSLESLWVYGCPNLKKLSMGPGSVPHLEKMYMSTFEVLEWEDEKLKARLQALQSIREEREPK